jgi:hypothetical protein
MDYKFLMLSQVNVNRVGKNIADEKLFSFDLYQLKIQGGSLRQVSSDEIEKYPKPDMPFYLVDVGKEIKRVVCNATAVDPLSTLDFSWQHLNKPRSRCGNELQLPLLPPVGFIGTIWITASRYRNRFDLPSQEEVEHGYRLKIIRGAEEFNLPKASTSTWSLNYARFVMAMKTEMSRRIYSEKGFWPQIKLLPQFLDNRKALENRVSQFWSSQANIAEYLIEASDVILEVKQPNVTWGGIPITRATFFTLRAGNKINDDIINAHVILVAEENKARCMGNCWVVNSFFMTKVRPFSPLISSLPFGFRCICLPVVKHVHFHYIFNFIQLCR